MDKLVLVVKAEDFNVVADFIGLGGYPWDGNG